MATASFNEIMSIAGNGKATFDGTKTVEVSFTAKMLPNGRFEGELVFPTDFLEDFMGFSSSGEITVFDFDGSSTLSGQETATSMRTCFLTSFESSMGEAVSLKSGFVAQEVIFQKDSEETKPTGRVLIGFELVNVFETFRVILNTDLGQLTLRNSKDMKALEKTMETYGAPMVSAQALLETRLDGSRSLGNVLNQATELIERLLRITSLAQGSWHTWVAVSVYKEGGPEDGFERLYLKTRYPKLKRPSHRSITNVAHSSYFIQSAWNGYSSEEVKKYGYDVALEWYNEANSAGVLESKFLNATTCLELMMDRYANVAGNEFYLTEGNFSTLKGRLESEATTWAKANGVNEEDSKGLRDNLNGLNRRSYSRKAKALLAFWRVKYDNLGVGIRDIVMVRNEITHTGGILAGDKQDRLFSTFQALMMILVRVFLAILRYEGQYFDWVRQDFVDFATVRE